MATNNSIYSHLLFGKRLTLLQIPLISDKWSKLSSRDFPTTEHYTKWVKENKQRGLDHTSVIGETSLKDGQLFRDNLHSALHYVNSYTSFYDIVRHLVTENELAELLREPQGWEVLVAMSPVAPAFLKTVSQNVDALGNLYPYIKIVRWTAQALMEKFFSYDEMQFRSAIFGCGGISFLKLEKLLANPLNPIASYITTATASKKVQEHQADIQLCLIAGNGGKLKEICQKILTPSDATEEVQQLMEIAVDYPNYIVSDHPESRHLFLNVDRLYTFLDIKPQLGSASFTEVVREYAKRMQSPTNITPTIPTEPNPPKIVLHPPKSKSDLDVALELAQRILEN